MSSQRYVVAGTRPWNRAVFERRLAKLPGRWTFVDEPEALEQALAAEAADRVFFLHWSWKVPASITERWECINFHMTDVPYGRGGSPLQNLVVRGHRETVVSALRMVDEFDAGPVYLKRPLDLAGTADEILARASEVAAGMIETIIIEHPEPMPQEGDVVRFDRRKPAESEVPVDAGIDEVYDFVRMLDGEGYPPAFIRHGRLRLELRGAVRHPDHVEADVRINVEDPS